MNLPAARRAAAARSPPHRVPVAARVGAAAERAAHGVNEDPRPASRLDETGGGVKRKLYRVGPNCGPTLGP
jgi:hypothetical protein